MFIKNILTCVGYSLLLSIDKEMLSVFGEFFHVFFLFGLVDVFSFIGFSVHVCHMLIFLGTNWTRILFMMHVFI